MMRAITMSLEELEKKAAAIQEAQMKWRTKTKRTATVDGVAATVDCHLRLLKVVIDPAAPTEREALERAVCLAVNQATEKSTQVREKHDGNAGGGFTSRMWEVMWGY